ncbi:aminomethyltransferase family protein [Nitriliruptor alkaliphilus]|uniref:aminomethyltransferase family protein n=1 Tax=Nitriliruptor alkaliphilus TaxID=427918 RepID=UPI0006981C2E|nr:aminomethyltransferase family protein [Nitriliruptor alkaliphilus]
MRQDSEESLQQLIDRTPDLVDYFYNDAVAPHFSRAGVAKTGAFIPPAFTNWRDEQRSWHETAALLHQSHHMPELFVEGPDAARLIERVGINSMANWTLDRAKQFVACTPRGHVIGDCVAYRLGEQRFELISGMPIIDWVHYNAVTGDYDVTVTKDEPSNINPTGGRINFRLQLDGPHAEKIFDKVVEGGAPEIKFFHTARVKIRGVEVLVLRHGMAGHRGVEISGPYAEEKTVRDALLEEGAEFGITPVGTQAYFSTQFSDGWMPYPVAGIFTGEEMRGFREWLSATGWEANTEIGGSFRSSDIEDYYVTPYDLGYGSIMKFDHDFIGREALEALPIEKRRTKVALVWNEEDVARVFASQFGPGPRYKAIELPIVFYSWNQFDEVRNDAGDLVGVSCHAGYLNSEGALISHALMNHGHAEIGSEVLVTWGEPNGGSRKPHVERHEQTQIRATIEAVPFSSSVRQMMREAVHAR